MNTPPRYTKRPLPDYRHMPGSTPHPTLDPAGHSYMPDVGARNLPDLNRVDWRTCEDYLYGIDLFNHGYWWECHEVLEELWHAAGHGSLAGHALQAVIQCAAAHLKMEARHPLSAGRLYAHSLSHIGQVPPVALGLDLEAMVGDTRAYLGRQTADPARLELDFGQS